MIPNFAHAQTYNAAMRLLAAGEHTIVSRVNHALLLQSARLVQHAALDFDGSLHSDRSCWAKVAARLPPNLEAADEAIRQYYYADNLYVPGESVVDLSDPDWFFQHRHPGNADVIEGGWVGRDVGWYMEGGLTQEDFADVGRNLQTREGAVPLIGMMDHTTIISFGLQAVILPWIQHHGVQASVVANRLRFDDSGRVIGHHPNLIAASTKRLAAEVFADGLAGSAAKILVLGDSIVDIHMMLRDSFNVLILPRTAGDAQLQKFRERGLQQMWPKLTMILHSDSLMPLVKLLLQARRTL